MSEKSLSTYEELLAEDPDGLRQEELILDATETLARALRSSGLTQSELAARLGKTKGVVSQILGGGKNLTLRTLADVAGALACKVRIQLRAEKAVNNPTSASEWGHSPAALAAKSRNQG
ncbi:MAG TPA: helix-turn-helix transcriptional regulator [Thermoanaerobaculia bacterium]|nr:helix-turn-helix transcriptional regulator [Thermoanaerobaculia bacterium]